MRYIVNYIRSLFCKHDWELLRSIKTYESEYSSRPCSHRVIYRCKKCGFVQKIKL